MGQTATVSGGPWRQKLAVLAALAVFLAGGCTSRGESSAEGEAPQDQPSANPYFYAEVRVETTPVDFGQNPSWTADGRVLSNHTDEDGVLQIYRSNLDGSDETCLTCGQPGPNGYPLEQPGGEWILFCSWRDREVHIGSPCLGGYGTDLYVMRSDGSDPVALTRPDPSEGDDPVDNYHPAWSPDGRSIVWTHVRFRDEASGGAEWTIRVADFETNGPSPQLTGETVVEPAGNHAYETHGWAPDGSGFLFTRIGGADDDGWMNTELYYTRIAGEGASREEPITEHLTDGSPAWDEQAVFTPDMRNVIWMSSRSHPTRYQTLVSAAQWLDFDAPQANNLFGPLFYYAIADPDFRTELFIMDLETRAIRQLTFDGAVVPEFHFDPSGLRLLWGQGGGDRSRIATFDLEAPTAQSLGTPDPEGQTPPEVGNSGRQQVVAPEVAQAAASFFKELDRLRQELTNALGR